MIWISSRYGNENSVHLELFVAIDIDIIVLCGLCYNINNNIFIVCKEYKSVTFEQIKKECNENK